MGDTPSWVLLVTFAFVLVGFAGVLAWARKRLRRFDTPPPPKGALHMTCGACHHPMVIAREQLVALSGPEMALVIRVKPGWVKQKLAEYECPHCSSAHVFSIDVDPPAYLGSDLYTPSPRGDRCMECGKTLARAMWPKGEYDNRIDEAPMSDDHGLTCQFCKALFCFACSDRNAKQRKKDGPLVCPRCFRQPVVHVFHG